MANFIQTTDLPFFNFVSYFRYLKKSLSMFSLPKLKTIIFNLLSTSCKWCTIWWCVWTVFSCYFVKRSLPITTTASPSLIMFIVMMLVLCILVINNLRKRLFMSNDKEKSNLIIYFLWWMSSFQINPKFGNIKE